MRFCSETTAPLQLCSPGPAQKGHSNTWGWSELTILWPPQHGHSWWLTVGGNTLLPTWASYPTLVMLHLHSTERGPDLLTRQNLKPSNPAQTSHLTLGMCFPVLFCLDSYLGKKTYLCSNPSSCQCCPSDNAASLY